MHSYSKHYFKERMADKRVSERTEMLRKYDPQGNVKKKKQKLSLVLSDKRRLNRNFVKEETGDVDQLFSNSMRTRVKDVGSKLKNVRLKYRKKIKKI